VNGPTGQNVPLRAVAVNKTGLNIVPNRATGWLTITKIDHAISNRAQVGEKNIFLIVTLVIMYVLGYKNPKSKIFEEFHIMQFT